VCENGVTEYVFHHDQMIVFPYYKHYIFYMNTVVGGGGVLTPITSPPGYDTNYIHMIIFDFKTVYQQCINMNPGYR